jgi:release factor glutamine methyltransferase
VKVASNKIEHVIDFFRLELKSVLEAGELEASINIAFEHFLGYNKNQLMLKSQENINQSDLLNLYDCCKQLRKGKPLQYILNEAWFYNLKFYVNEHVLIPRPETEELVDLIIRENRNCESLLDVGTGSGCIPISIKAHIKNCNVNALDISSNALHIAKRNAKLNGVEINFLELNILDEPTLVNEPIKKFEVIVSNPPYIKHSEKSTLNNNVLLHEPHLALFVDGEDDIIFYKKIIDFSSINLINGGKLYFELNPLTANAVKDYAINSNIFSLVELQNDLSGNVRFLKAIKLK